jgi:hypothetical protein
MKSIIFVAIMVLIVTGRVNADPVVSFSDYDLSNIKYDNRLRFSNDRDDFDFDAESSWDINGDAKISGIEYKTFYEHSESCDIYIGNAHSRYEINNALVWIGLSGTFDSFRIDETLIRSDTVLSVLDESIVWPYDGVESFFDSVVLIDIASPISTRASSSDPIASSNPFHLRMHSLITDDADFYAYITGFGAIKSGFNSQSPETSDILWQPDMSAVAPEPASIVLFSLGGIGLVIKRKLMIKS